MIAKFDLYDFIANLIPGLTFLWCVQILAGLVGWRLPLGLAGGLAETLVLIAIGYVSGLLLQGFSQYVIQSLLLRLWDGFPSERWLLPDDTHFSTGYKHRLLELIKERFQIPTEPEIPRNCQANCKLQLRLKKNRELFYLCYNYVSETSHRPVIFNTHYGLFRSLLGMFSLLSLASLSGLVRALIVQPSQVVPFGVWTFLFVIAAWIAYARCKKRSEDFAQSVYDLFITTTTSMSNTKKANANT